jgi:hypothetical protein
MKIKFKITTCLVFVSGILLTFMLGSCRKEEKFPVEPFITFKSIDIYEKNKFIITIGFTDGDGDLGLANKDTLPPFDTDSKYFYNYFTTFSQKILGVWVPITYFNPPYYYRIPDLTPSQRNKNIKGDIKVDFNGGFYTTTSNGISDTFKVDIYITDRALHESNTITSPEFTIMRP